MSETNPFERLDSMVLEVVAQPSFDIGVVWFPGQPIYDVIALEICLQARRDGMRPLLIELDSELGTSFDGKVALAGLLSKRLRSSWSRMIRNEIRLHKLSVWSSHKRSRPSQPGEESALSILSTLKSPRDLCSLRSISRELADSVYSALCTDSMRAYHQPSRTWKRKSKRLIHAFFDGVYHLNEFADNLPSQVCVPNGRFPHQAGIGEACQKLNRSVRYYEVGGSRYQTFHFEDHRTQSRKFLTDRKNPPADLEAKGLEYLSSRQHNSAINPFALQMEASHNHLPRTKDRKVQGRSIVTYFSSSMDEFVGQGNDWTESKWADQWLALDDLVPALKFNGFELRIRVHPNTLNKTWREFLWIEGRARSYDCEVIPSWSSRNSYDVALESDLILSWGSTIALEAAALGKQACVLAPTFFDVGAGVQRIEIDQHSRIKVRGEKDSRASARMLGLLGSHGRKFSYSNNLLVEARRTELGYAKSLRLAGKILLPIEVTQRPQVGRRIVEALGGEKAIERILGRAVSLVQPSVRSNSRHR